MDSHQLDSVINIFTLVWGVVLGYGFARVTPCGGIRSLSKQYGAALWVVAKLILFIIGFALGMWSGFYVFCGCVAVIIYFLGTGGK